MVYRGKPSAGCENCRKAKKRCGLEQPACARCVKLNRHCSGYRDVTELQVEDESQAVMRRINRQKYRPLPEPSSRTVNSENSSIEPCRSNDDLPDASDEQNSSHEDSLSQAHLEWTTSLGTRYTALPAQLHTSVHELATVSFFSRFTASTGPASFLRHQADNHALKPVVNLALKACGMAAFSNLYGGTEARMYARAIYANSLKTLNAALKDANRCKTDESLVAVGLLAYYENFMCDGRESIFSWKTHMAGATQLLKLRGKMQFQNELGRKLYRDHRQQILISCLWAKSRPPPFLCEWQDDLTRHTIDWGQISAVDSLAICTCNLANVNHRIQHGLVSVAEAYAQLAEVDAQYTLWRDETFDNDYYKFTELTVPPSPHVWRSTVHCYGGFGVATFWNTYRSVRIMITRLQDKLLKSLHQDPTERNVHHLKLRRIRRELMDEICLSIPSQLGHASPGYNSCSVLSTAYGSIWPLFFACTCAMEEVGQSTWDNAMSGYVGDEYMRATSPNYVQAMWILDRLDYISRSEGLQWAAGVAASLRGQSTIETDMLPGDPDEPPWRRQMHP